MSGVCASSQPSSSQPPLPEDLIAGINGNQRAKPTADVLHNREVLKRAVAQQISLANQLVTDLEITRSNLNRLETALVLIYTGVVTPIDVSTAGEDHGATIKEESTESRQPTK